MRDNKLSIFEPRSLIGEDFLGSFFRHPFATFDGARMEMFEKDNKIHVRMEAPGFQEDDIEITLEDDVLTIKGNVQEEKKEEDKDKKYYYSEMKQQSFTRSISLPTKVKDDEIEAEVKNGVLEIIAPKAEEVLPKRINLKKTM